jgi:hypothetical protein
VWLSRRCSADHRVPGSVNCACRSSCVHQWIDARHRALVWLDIRWWRRLASTLSDRPEPVSAPAHASDARGPAGHTNPLAKRVQSRAGLLAESARTIMPLSRRGRCSPIQGELRYGNLHL